MSVGLTSSGLGVTLESSPQLIVDQLFGGEEKWPDLIKSLQSPIPCGAQGICHRLHAVSTRPMSCDQRRQRGSCPAC